MGTKAMLEDIAEQEPGAPTRIDCCMWHQGHKDSGKGKWKSAYQANLVNFVKEMWRALEVSCPAQFPFVPLELHSSDARKMKDMKGYIKINEAFHNACQELAPAAHMKKTSPEMAGMIESHFHEDGIHSNSRGLVLKGNHLADTFVDMLESKE